MATTNAQPGESVVALLRDVVTELQNVVDVLKRIAKTMDGNEQ